MNEKNFSQIIQDIHNSNLGTFIRKLRVTNIEIFIIYIPQITNKDSISTNIIRPILQYSKNEPLNIDTVASSVVLIDKISMDDDENKILEYILRGNCIIIMPGENQYIVANAKYIAQRNIEAPDLETTLRGPKDSFTENFDINLSLIRYRLKDPELRINKFIVGKRTKTNVGVIYINDVANPKYVKEITKRLHQINIDGIVDSGYIQKFISNSSKNLFPEIGIVERSDLACASLLEGKICVIIEGSAIVLCAPKVFNDFIDSSDDHYDNLYFGIFVKFLRLTSLMISLQISAMYVAIVGFHADILPASYIMLLASSREPVPFNALLEATLMEFVAEILREASIRLPKRIGAAIGIVGTIVIGQAAVAAGIVSPLMVVIVSLSTMCSFVAPDYTIMNPIRLLKFFMIFITGMFGLFGFIIGTTFIVINLLSTSSFGVPYFAPVSPLNIRDLKSQILSDVTLSKNRPRFLRTRNKKNQK